MKILKFGGSSVGSAQAMRLVLAIVAAESKRSDRVIVVVSALQGVTDTLLSLATRAASGDSSWEATLADLSARHRTMVCEIGGDRSMSSVERDLEALFSELEQVLRGISLVREASARSRDLVASFGERLSATIVGELSRSFAPEVAVLDTRTVITTDADYGAARVDFAQTERTAQNCALLRRPLVIATGFIAATSTGETTTLGRGGSDYTAAILGAVLQADEIEIWTDVDGVLTADPRKVPQAFSIPALSYREAMELSHFGAKVIYPPTMQPAMDKRIPVWIKNTFNATHPGTRISAENPTRDRAVTGITCLSDVALFRVEGSGMVGVAGISARLFGALAREKISVILISQASSEHSICFAVLPAVAQTAQRALREEFALELASRLIDEPVAEGGLSIIAVVGENMRNTPGIAGRMFASLAQNGINIVAIAQGSSELNISAVVAAGDQEKAIRALHDAFFLSGISRVHLYLVGSGGVASALLSQLEAHAPALRESHGVELVLSGVANTRGMQSSAGGMPFRFPEEITRGAGPRGSYGLALVEAIEKHNLPSSVLIDCSASDEPPDLYERLLQRGVSVVAANKRAGSGDLQRHQRISTAARLGRAKFRYEATVGAGLPIISTLHDLIASGDRVLRIEGLLSGTLGYLFSVFDGGRPFSECVREAFNLGYTEPDPRDDLSGVDVARKLVILARDCGLARTLEDVEIESLVPAAVRDRGGVDEFFAALPGEDAAIHHRWSEAHRAQQRLRYLAVLTPESLSVSLRAVDATSPFYALAGADNMVVFTTERYRERPLVVRGPGAGREVTAAGVFADVLRVSPVR